MGRVIWSPSALEDADSIAQYIARDSSDRAALFIHRLFELADRLPQFPQAGRTIPAMSMSERRAVFVRSYRLMYLIEGDSIWITAIVHGSRHWTPPSQ